MKDVLDKRAAFVSFIFSAFGSALTRLFVFDSANIGWDVTGFATLISLIVSLLISVFFIKKNTRKIRIRRYVLIGLLLVAGFIFFSRMNKLMCPERINVLDSSGKNDSSYTIHIITGKELIDKSDPVLNQINKSSVKCSLCDSLATHDPYKIWTSKSIQNSFNNITWSYIFFVVLVVALITHLTEELLPPPSKKKEKQKVKK